jgi:hypothetical protein
MILPMTWSEIGSHSEIKMAVMKTGSENNVRTEGAGEVPRPASHTFSAMPDSGVTLPTWTDIGRHSELKVSATKLILIYRCRPISGHAVSIISESDIFKNMG